jgi:hypothetical protein
VRPSPGNPVEGSEVEERNRRREKRGVRWEKVDEESEEKIRDRWEEDDAEKTELKGERIRIRKENDGRME